MHVQLGRQTGGPGKTDMDRPRQTLGETDRLKEVPKTKTRLLKDYKF